MKIKRLKKRFIFLLIICFMFVLTFMSTVYSSSDSDDLQLCTLSEEYKEWLKLSSEEQAEVIMPVMCDNSADSTSNHYFSYTLKSSNLPSSYSSVTEGYTTDVKNQQSTGGCWTFATTTGLESYLKKLYDINYSLSTRHIEYSSTRSFKNGSINDHGYNRSAGDGGNYIMSSSYLINHYGAILESEMPFENNENTIDISEIEGKTTVVDVNNVALISTDDGTCSTSDIETIKEYVYNNGAVAISTYITSSSSYYNSNTYAYYYNGLNSPNHAVTIVGWDDDYAVSNFSSSNRPSSNGAWIVQNSYGSSWGNGGYYYISYEDVNNCYLGMTIDDADTEVEDNSYFNDKLGFNGFMGYGTTTAYGMSVFTKSSTSSEILKEVTFGSNGAGSYKIYYYAGDASSVSVSKMTLIGSGTMDYSGYITHTLEDSIILDGSVTTFSIVVYYSMDSSTMPVPISYSGSTLYSYIEADDDTSFLSYNGSSWTSLSDYSSTYTYIVSIKAFTDDYEADDSNNDDTNEITSSTYTIDQDNLYIYVQPSTSVSSFLSNINNYSSGIYSGSTSITSGVVATGMTIDSYIIIVKGDVTGDGYVKMNDVMKISDYIVNGSSLGTYYKVAADVTGDSNIKMNDVMKISDYIVEGGSL